VSWLRRQWLRLWRWFRPGPAPFAIVLVEDLPDEPRPRTLYLAGEPGHPWCAALACPCGCGDVIRLNLLGDARPCWSVVEHRDGTVSVEPSVWRQKGCRSHFFVRRGYIDWCRADAFRA
jgi:hypothetical protein